MSQNIINNSYVVGVGGRNLVLNTLGRVYVKKQDSFFELNFGGNPVSETAQELPEIIVVGTKAEAQSLAYPGDNKLVVSLDGGLFIASGGSLTEIKLDAKTSTPTLEGLTINGQLTINYPDGSPLVLNGNENFPPFIINSQALVTNLNAEYLNGFSSDDFLRSSTNAIINGSWSFNNNVNISGVLNTSRLFVDGKEFPQENGSQEHIVFGTGNYSWVSDEIFSNNVEQIEDYVVEDTDLLDFVQYAYDTEFLNQFNSSGEITIDFWNSIFFTSAEPVVVRDLTLQIEIDNVNSILSSNNLPTIDNYMSVYYGLCNGDPLDLFTGCFFSIPIIADILYGFLYVTINEVLAGDSDIYRIVNIVEDRIFVQAKNNCVIDDKFVRIGHLTDPNKKGSLHFNAITNQPSYLDVTNDYQYSYSTTPIGFSTKLANNNNINARFGNLNGLASDPILGNITGTGLFLKGNSVSDFVSTTNNFTISDLLNYGKNNLSGLYLRNPHFTYESGASLLNPDGSGFLSNGRLLWSKDYLNITNPNINVAGGFITINQDGSGEIGDWNWGVTGDIFATKTKVGVMQVGNGLNVDSLGKVFVESPNTQFTIAVEWDINAQTWTVTPRADDTNSYSIDSTHLYDNGVSGTLLVNNVRPKINAVTVSSASQTTDGGNLLVFPIDQTYTNGNYSFGIIFNPDYSLSFSGREIIIFGQLQ